MKKRLKCNNLTEELVEEILVRLPAKSLVRFKRVCKSWNSLIGDQRFIERHLQLNISNTAPSSSSSKIDLVLWWHRQLVIHGADDDYDDVTQVVSLLSIDKDNSEGDGCSESDSDSEDAGLLPCRMDEIFVPMRPKVLHEEEGFLKPLKGFHCNGILCLVDTSPLFCERVAFFNPAIRQCKFLRTSISADDYCFSACGFGYDSKANVYKFVRILTPYDSSRVSKAEVYTLGRNSFRAIKLDINCCLQYRNVTYLKGFCYWLFGENERILSFDMSKEKFCSFTASHTGQGLRSIQIDVWNDSLVMFSSREKGIFDMWTMGSNNRGAEDVEWTKHLTIGPLPSIRRPLTFWRNDELLMETNNGQMMSYHLCTKKLKKLSIEFEEPMAPDLTHASFYVGSLVSLSSNKII